MSDEIRRSPVGPVRESYEHARSYNVRIVFEMHEVKELLDQIDALTAELAAETALLDSVEADRAQVIAERDALVALAKRLESEREAARAERDELRAEVRRLSAYTADDLIDDLFGDDPFGDDSQQDHSPSHVDGGQSDG